MAHRCRFTQEQDLNNITQINSDQEDEIYAQSHQQALVDENNDEESKNDREYEKSKQMIQMNFLFSFFINVYDSYAVSSSSLQIIYLIYS